MADDDQASETRLQVDVYAVSGVARELCRKGFAMSPSGHFCR
jgi:hypothetical protein